MNLGEMKSRGWWAIDDNEANPSEISAIVMAELINEAIRDLGPMLNIIKPNEPTFTDGVASLPSDFISPVACYDVYDGKEIPLRQIRNIKEKVKDTDTTSQFYIPNGTEIYIYGTDPEGTVTLWYQAHETALTEDSDTPDNIPAKFHIYIPQVYIKAQNYLKKNMLNEYGGMMDIWEQVKREVYAACHADRLSNSDMVEDIYGRCEVW